MSIRDLNDDDGLLPPSADQFAGEYVLGLLDAPARQQAEARIASDAGFARLVAQWQQHLAPLLEELGSAPVPPALWPGIRQRLGWDAYLPPPRRVLWRRTGFWQTTTALAAALALVTFALRPAMTPKPPVPVASTPAVAPEAEAATRPVTPLLHDDGRPGWLATVDAAHGTVLMVPVPAPTDAQGRAAELWLIPAGQAPRSLGLVSNDRAHTVSVPASLRADLVDGSVLAITLEPSSGAPHAAPSGPVIAKGDIAVL